MRENMFSGVFKQTRSFKFKATPCLANTLLSRFKKKTGHRHDKKGNKAENLVF